MKAFSRITLLLLSVLACGAAQAAESVDVTIAGRLAPVNSCVPKLSGNIINYGVIKASELDRDGPTRLTERPFSMVIDCASPINQLVVSFIDHKSGDAIRDTTVMQHPYCKTSDCGDAVFGLGRDQQDRKIGGLFLRERASSIDNQNVNWRLYDAKPDISDPGFTRRKLFGPRDGEHVTRRYVPSGRPCEGLWTREGKNCSAGTSFSVQGGITPIIDTKDRDITDDIKLDGAFTVEIAVL